MTNNKDFYDYVLSRVRGMQKRQDEVRKKIKHSHYGNEAIILNVEYESLQYAITMIWSMLENKKYIKEETNEIK